MTSQTHICGTPNAVALLNLLEYSHHSVYLWHAQSEQCLCHPLVPLAQSSSLLSSQTVPCIFAGGKHLYS